jgi:hypothetical protein
MERNLRVCSQTKSLGATTHAPHISHEKAPGDAMKVHTGHPVMDASVSASAPLARAAARAASPPGAGAVSATTLNASSAASKSSTVPWAGGGEPPVTRPTMALQEEGGGLEATHGPCSETTMVGSLPPPYPPPQFLNWTV